MAKLFKILTLKTIKAVDNKVVEISSRVDKIFKNLFKSKKLKKQKI